jgi:hypothetical protein
MSVGLYIDPETGANISTNSMLKTFLRCPKQAEYKYYRRLKPKHLGAPLTRGKWLHSLFEAFYLGEDWKLVHAKYVSDFRKLFDEEKDKLGDLPTECMRIMLGYIWHYKHHSWTVLGVEQMIEAELPDGTIFRGKYDMLIEDEFGIWLVDHKSHKTLPDFSFRLLDFQSARYIWAARRNGIPVQGFIWNYVKTKPQTVPTLIKDKSRLSKPTMKNCDFPTAARALKSYKEEFGLDIEPYKPWLRNLKAQQFQYGMPQTSEFFRRNVLEKDDALLERALKETFHTSMRMHDYDFSQTDAVERVPERSCNFSCSYPELCQTELFGGNTDLILRRNYKVGDPMDYYYDDRIGDRETA